MRLRRSALIACLALLALGACTEDRTPDEDAPVAAYGYTCCDAKDVDRQYRPGETVKLHWIVTKATAGPTVGPQSTVLAARLTGPYTDVEALKADRSQTGAADYAAKPLRPVVGPEERPESLIPIPANAEPGYYNLIFTVSQGRAQVSGASVVRVVAKR